MRFAELDFYPSSFMARSASARTHVPLKIRVKIRVQIFAEVLANFKPSDIASPLSEYSSTMRTIKSLGGLLYDQPTHCKWLCQHVDTLRHEVYPHDLLPKLSSVFQQDRVTITAMNDFSSRETRGERTVQAFLEDEHDQCFPNSYRYIPQPRKFRALKLRAEKIVEKCTRGNVAMLHEQINDLLRHMTSLCKHFLALHAARYNTKEWQDLVSGDERIWKLISMLDLTCHERTRNRCWPVVRQPSF